MIRLSLRKVSSKCDQHKCYIYFRNAALCGSWFCFLDADMIRSLALVINGCKNQQWIITLVSCCIYTRSSFPCVAFFKVWTLLSYLSVYIFIYIYNSLTYHFMLALFKDEGASLFLETSRGLKLSSSSWLVDTEHWCSLWSWYTWSQKQRWRTQFINGKFSEGNTVSGLQ